MDRMTPIDIDQVSVGGELGRRIYLTAQKNFLALDVDNDFLRLFRQRLPRSQIQQWERYTGLGHLIDAGVLLGHYSGDREVVDRKEYLVEEIIKTQTPGGYIGVFEEESDAGQLWTEYCVHDAAHLVLGLVHDFQHFANQAALKAARKLADYLVDNWPNRPRGASFTTEGSAEALIDLYHSTGERRYLRFAADEKMGRPGRIIPNVLREWEQPLYSERPMEPERYGLEPSPIPEPTQDRSDIRLEFSSNDICHMYRLFARSMMQLRLHRIEPDPKLLTMARRILAAMTRRHRAGMLVTGATSYREGWHEDQAGDGPAIETCATVYQLRFLDELMRIDGDLRHGDIMERAIFNSLLAAQDPEGRQVRYYTPFTGPREYFHADTYCCPNNFRRGVGALPGFIYYRWNGGVAINLYTTSTAEIKLSSGVLLRLDQETDYPTTGLVTLTLRPAEAAEFALRLRVPRWCGDATASVNSAEAQRAVGGRPLEIRRRWVPGDTVTLDMPMSWRWVRGGETQAGRAALLRGPVVYCLSRDSNELPPGMELRDITVGPTSVTDPAPDERWRPDGLQCRVDGWSSGRGLDDPADLHLALSEFPDPTGEEVFFRLRADAAVDDELIVDEEKPEKH